MLGLAPNEVIAIGDSVEHDTAGATAAGVDALFVAGGIHAEELKVGSPGSPSWDEDGTSPQLTGLFSQFEAHPRYFIDYFKL